ncbi:MAG TPA: relaxase/mobilization nuclease domain-containing protein [Flavipsychrobacter sp.]|nr:relaxase/mobilization nuclease domain-containing protein [Flavipsychrobacter sp.]
MMARIVKPGRSFKGCIQYNLQEHRAELLYAEAVRTQSVQTIIHDFNMQRKLNPGLGRAVGHIALTWSPNDTRLLTDEIMVERAQEYMDKMKIGNTQYIIALHKDRPHPHVHIVYNRVDNEGKTISDKFQKQRNVKVCKELTQKYGYYVAEGKEQVNRQRLTGADKVKYELYDGITKALKESQNWPQLESNLLAMGITMQYKYRNGTEEIQGVSFCKWDVKFKGSKIDRSLSYGKISQQLSLNKLSQAQSQKIHLSRHKENTGKTESHFAGKLVNQLLRPEYNQPMPDDMLTEEQKRKRKNKSQHL